MVSFCLVQTGSSSQYPENFLGPIAVRARRNQPATRSQNTNGESSGSFSAALEQVQESSERLFVTGEVDQAVFLRRPFQRHDLRFRVHRAVRCGLGFQSCQALLESLQIVP